MWRSRWWYDDFDGDDAAADVDGGDDADDDDGDDDGDSDDDDDGDGDDNDEDDDVDDDVDYADVDNDCGFWTTRWLFYTISCILSAVFVGVLVAATVRQLTTPLRLPSLLMVR